ncbi:hypothetical protein [Sphingobacterium detergens]
MTYEFIEVFRENVPIAVRLQDLLKYIEKAKELKCYEMRIIVSFDPANPGINLIFGRIIIKNRLQTGGFYPAFDPKIHTAPLGEEFLLNIKNSLRKDHPINSVDTISESIRSLRWIEVAKELPEVKKKIFFNENVNWESEHIEKLRAIDPKQWQREYLNSPAPEEPEKLHDKNGKINNNRH